MNNNLSPVTIQQMLVFLAVVKNGGFQKASEELHMTQSTVSRSIAKLETVLELQLFERTTRSVQLTEAGKILYDDWSKIISEMNNSYQVAFSTQHEDHDSLTIGVSGNCRLERYLWPLVDPFQKENPTISLKYVAEDMEVLQSKLINLECDIIFVPDFEKYSLEEAKMKWTWGAKSNASLLMDQNNPLSVFPALKTEQIVDQEFIALGHEENSNYVRDLKARLSPYKTDICISTSYRNAAEMRFVFHNGCPGVIMVDEFVNYATDYDIKRIPVVDQKNGLLCAWNPANKNKSVQRFIRFVKDHCPNYCTNM